MKIIKIPAPICDFGDQVWVHNYRKKLVKGKQVFELGLVCGMKYEHTFGGKFVWKYTVRLARKSDILKNIYGHKIGGNPIHLYVSNKGIKVC